MYTRLHLLRITIQNEHNWTQQLRAEWIQTGNSWCKNITCHPDVTTLGNWIRNQSQCCLTIAPSRSTVSLASNETSDPLLLDLVTSLRRSESLLSALKLFVVVDQSEKLEHLVAIKVKWNRSEEDKRQDDEAKPVMKVQEQHEYMCTLLALL